MKKIISLLCILLLLGGCKAENMNHDSKIVIALLDSGVSSSAIPSEHLLSGYNYVCDSDETEDLLSHGTAVASIILGCDSADVEPLAPNAYVVPLVIATMQDSKIVPVSLETLAKAVRDSVDIYQADIINMSLGIQNDNKLLLEAVEYAEKKGVLVVSSVGNDGTEGKPYYPASYDTVLSVGSHDKNGRESAFSQKGADVLAQGEDIILASRKGKKYGTKGTSYATGFVSAKAAVYLAEHPAVSMDELRSYLKTQQYYQK